MKLVLIENCLQCPYKNMIDVFGKLRYVPVCKKVGERLPYVEVIEDISTVKAKPTGVIPKWCPLPDKK